MGKRNRYKSRDERIIRWPGLRGIEIRRSRTGFDGAAIEAYRFVRQESGKQKTPDFVLVHGIGVSSRAFGPTAALLARHGDVHLVDLPGYGHSPKPESNLTIEAHADVLAHYLRERGLDHPVLVGHSMGAQVVADLAARYPELVDHVVLMGPVMTPDGRTARKAIAQFIKNAKHEPLPMTLIAVTDYLFRSGLPYSLAQTKHLLGEAMEAVAPRVTAKTLVISGTKDAVSPPAWGKQLAEAFPHGSFATVAGPHGAMWVSPEKIASLIDAHADQ